ncbi:MAG: hypothetical protein JSU01_20715 [Bacteroidetes bacterium]|nr:hypothetical protein [Bacteroidota bacterium]
MLYNLHTYRASFARILVTVGIDLVLLAALVAYTQPIPESAIIAIPVILALFILNIGIAVVARFVWKKLYFTFALNSILAPLIFYLVLMGWYTYRPHLLFITWKFDNKGKHYELTLRKKEMAYSFLELDSDFPGSGSVNMSGSYFVRNDTIHLTDILSPMVIYKDTLIGFAKEKIGLIKE